MLSKKLILLAGLGAILFFNLAIFVSEDYALGVIPCGVLIAVIYFMAPQINWWWYQHHPPKLPEPLVRMLLARLPFFQKLTPPDKTKFVTRMAMYLEANDFQAKGPETLPEDVKGVIAATVVQLTFGLEDYLLNQFEHIIVYPHPFPSPQHEQWHACEHYAPDGAIIFSAEQLMAGFAAPRKFFHIGLYEYARVLQACRPELKFPAWETDIWEKLAQVSSLSKDAVEKWVGLSPLDVTAVAVAHFFVFPEKFKAELPGGYEALAGVLGQRP